MADELSARVKVPIEDLGPGWLVDRDIYDRDVVLIKAGITITTTLLDTLRRRGITELFVSRDSQLAHGQRPANGADPLLELFSNRGQIYEQHKVETAIPSEQLEQATGKVEDLFSQLELGRPADYDEIRQLSKSLVETFSARSQLSVKLFDLDQVDRYTYRHSVNVGLLFLMVASRWVDSSKEQEELLMGAMLHDLGKVRVGSEIINRPGKLSPEDWAVMRMHPVWSAEMLNVEASPAAVAVARWHHERLDGAGYPDGLTGVELDRYVRLSSICDVYDALTTKRSYKDKMSFAKAIDIILQGCGTQFDPQVAHEFIRRLGRYPTGSFVRLNTGEVAVVLRANEQAVNRPVVSRVCQATGALVEQPEELDLSQHSDLFITELVTSHDEPKD